MLVQRHPAGCRLLSFTGYIHRATLLALCSLEVDDVESLLLAHFFEAVYGLLYLFVQFLERRHVHASRQVRPLFSRALWRNPLYLANVEAGGLGREGGRLRVLVSIAGPGGLLQSSCRHRERWLAVNSLLRPRLQYGYLTVHLHMRVEGLLPSMAQVLILHLRSIRQLEHPVSGETARLAAYASALWMFKTEFSAL